MNGKKLYLSVLTLGIALVLVMNPLLVHGNTSNTWGVETDQIIIWNLAPPEGNDIYVEARVTNVAENLTFTTRILDPRSGDIIVDAEWDDIVRNYVLSLNNIDVLKADAQSYEDMSRVYLGQQFNATKIVVNSDITVYLDLDTGIFLEADVDMGEVKYDLLIASLGEPELESFIDVQDFEISGMPAGLVLGAAFIATTLLVTKKRQD